MLTQYQFNKYAISRQKATVIKITVLAYYSAPYLSAVENLEFIFRYCMAFSPNKEELHICSLWKAIAGQVGLLARIREFRERVLPVYLKTKCFNCPVCLFGLICWKNLCSDLYLLMAEILILTGMPFPYSGLPKCQLVDSGVIRKMKQFFVVG